MMTSIRHRWMSILGWGVLPICGCQMGEVFYRPPAAERGAGMGEVVLAGEFGEPGTPATSGPAEAATGPSSRPAGKGGYTAPGKEVQQISSFIVASAVGAPSRSFGAGREAGESQVSASDLGGFQASSGLAGLGAPQPVTANAVVGQPGLQRGFAIGLGLAGPNTIFTRQVNRASGPGGRCQELVNAGFFNRDLATCENHFR